MQSSEPDPVPERQDIATGDGEGARLNSTERAQWLVLGGFLLTLGGAMALTLFQHHHDLQTGVFVVLALASILGLQWHQNRQRYYQSLLARQQSEHNMADEKLRKLGKAVEQSPESIVITDLAGNIEYSNLAFSKISGYSAEEAL
jgi:PAS domain-containing protein